MRVNNNLVRQGLLFCGYFFLSFVFSSLALLAIGVLIPRKWGNYSPKNCNLNICISNTDIHSNIIEIFR
jgi:hypothetical protein